MRKVAFAATIAAISSIGGAAFADGMYKGKAKYIEPAPVYIPVNTWAGFYFGVNAGYAWNSDDKNINYSIPGVANNIVTTRGFETEGAFGGVQVGYNWQAGRFVLGVETDLQGGELSSDLNQRLFAGIVTVNGKQEIDYFGTVRGRLGYDFGQTLVYVTGGFAYGNIETTVNAKLLGLIDIARVSNSDTETGYVVGGGFEHKLSPSWSVKAEYQYIDLGSTKLNGDILGIIPLRTNEIDNDFHTVRIGVNYRFNACCDHAPLK